MSRSAGRQRTYDWEDPERLHDAVSERSGLELLTDIVDGALALPPINSTLGMSVSAVELGRVAISLIVQEWHYNQTGTMHGSVPAALLDSAMGSAIHTRLPVGRSYATIDLSVRYVRPANQLSGELRCEGEVVSLGRRVATAQGRIVDSRGKIIATGTTSCLVFDKDSKPAG